MLTVAMEASMANEINGGKARSCKSVGLQSAIGFDASRRDR
jgi:hypothetical protein